MAGPTPLNRFGQAIWFRARPIGLIIVWVTAVLFAWAAAGRHANLSYWILGVGTLSLAIGLFALLAATLKLFQIRRRHHNFNQDGVADAVRLSNIQRRGFRAGHAIFAGVSLIAGALAALALRGLPISAFVLAVFLIPGIVFLWKLFGTNRASIVGADLFVVTAQESTKTGAQAVEALSHAARISAALKTAHGVNDGSIEAREFLTILRHPLALWPSLVTLPGTDFLHQVNWRIRAATGLTLHVVIAGVLSWLLAMFTPVNFLPPIQSPLALLEGLSEPVPENPPEAEDQTSNDTGDSPGEDEDSESGQSESTQNENGENASDPENAQSEPSDSGAQNSNPNDEATQDGDGSGPGEGSDRGEDTDSGQGDASLETGDTGSEDTDPAEEGSNSENGNEPNDGGTTDIVLLLMMLQSGRRASLETTRDDNPRGTHPTWRQRS